MDELATQAREQAKEERHLYALLVLDGLEIPWVAMRGDFARLDELLADMSSVHERASVPQSGDALMGALLMKIIWGGQPEELRRVVLEIKKVTVMPVTASTAGVLCRIGEIDEARTFLETHTIDLSPHWWFSTMESAMAAEAALSTGLKDLAADAYAALSEFSGQPACAGSGPASARSTRSWRWPPKPPAKETWPPATPTTPPGSAKSGGSPSQPRGSPTSARSSASRHRTITNGHVAAIDRVPG